MTVLETVAELVVAVANERLRLMNEGDSQRSGGAVQFMKAITGVSDADVLETLRRDPMVWITAIVMYLEQQRSERAETPVRHETETTPTTEAVQRETTDHS